MRIYIFLLAYTPCLPCRLITMASKVTGETLRDSIAAVLKVKYWSSDYCSFQVSFNAPCVAYQAPINISTE